jgi:hypothetical protein
MWHQYGPRAGPPLRIVTPPKKTTHRTHPGPSLGPGRPRSTRPLARRSPPVVQLVSPESSSGLFQSIGQLGTVTWWYKDQVIDPYAKPLKVRAPLLLLLKFGNQLMHKLPPKGFVGRPPECELHDRGHHCLERDKHFSHLDVA